MNTLVLKNRKKGLFSWIKGIIKNKKTFTFNDKVIVLKQAYNNYFKDIEVNSNSVDIPYFIKANEKITKIIQQNLVDIEFKKYCAYKNVMRYL